MSYWWRTQDIDCKNSRPFFVCSMQSLESIAPLAWSALDSNPIVFLPSLTYCFDTRSRAWRTRAFTKNMTVLHSSHYIIQVVFYDSVTVFFIRSTGWFLASDWKNHCSWYLTLHLIFDLLPTRSLKLEEERINVLSQELEIKKSLLEDAEANYHRRLNEEVQRCQNKLLSQGFETYVNSHIMSIMSQKLMI